MSLRHALLTALVERPRSGSELARSFDRSIGNFWHATHQQIYRELTGMEEAGWIESLPAESTRGRRRAYRVLPNGRKELKRWTAQADDPTPLRFELILRFWAESMIGPTALASEVRRLMDLHQEKARTYQNSRDKFYSNGPLTREAALRNLVLDAGVLYEQYWVDVTSKALEILDAPPERWKGG